MDGVGEGEGDEPPIKAAPPKPIAAKPAKTATHSATLTTIMKIKAGTLANAHLIMNQTIDQNGMSMSATVTRGGGEYGSCCIVGFPFRMRARQ